MTSKATKLQRKARRREARRKVSLAGGDVATVRASTRDAPRMAEDASITAIDARMRQMGLDNTPEGRAKARDRLACDLLGRAILTTVKSTDERAALWGAMQHMRRVWASYYWAIGAPNPNAQSLSILLPPDTMTTSADAPAFDDRPEADRARSAISAYMAVQGWLGHCDNAARSACLMAVIDGARVVNLLGVIRALQCVCDGMAGRKIVWRGVTS